MIREFLRRSPLFADLPEADLDWLSARVETVSLAAGEVLIREGEPAEAAYIILEGELEVQKKSDKQEFSIGVRAEGEVIGEMALLDHSRRTATVKAARPSRLAKIRAGDFQQLLSQKPSAALAILHTVTGRLRQNEALLRQNEKLAALGTLAAGLAHELNNPAAAAQRSLDQLRSALAGWVQACVVLEKLPLTVEQHSLVDSLRPGLEKAGAAAPALDPLARSEQEAEVEAWLEKIGLENAWELAPALASAGPDLQRLRGLDSAFEPAHYRPLITWFAAGRKVYALLEEARLGSGRVSEIVKAVKAYSYLDQAPVQEVDIHAGLENTLVILRHKLTDGIRVRREYAAGLPRIEAHGSQLNQVWTNLIDNAVDAMAGHGELTLRTYSQESKVIVEIDDTGPEIPPEIQGRLFEPFFTTKPPGQGTGLGLHVAHTIVSNHHGRIQLSSGPGLTRFQVVLPMQIPR